MRFIVVIHTLILFYYIMMPHTIQNLVITRDYDIDIYKHVLRNPVNRLIDFPFITLQLDVNDTYISFTQDHICFIIV